MIQVQHLRKVYDNSLAVDDVSFSLAGGQICGMIGPNGAGKTTTMRCIAGLLRATEGTLSVAGYSVSDEPLELKRRLAYVPDDPPLFDDLTVQQHLEFIGRIYGVADHRVKTERLLDQFDLAKKRDAGAMTLSRGMRQKLAIACAYLYDPSVLLLDEPLTGLDPPGIRTLLESIRARADAGATIIISSHLLAMIEDVCTHLLVMQSGRVQHFGTTAEVRGQFPDDKTLEAAYFAATSQPIVMEQRRPFPSMDIGGAVS